MTKHDVTGCGGVHTLVGHLPEGYDASVLINTVDPSYVNHVADPEPLPGPYPALDAVVDAFNISWNEIHELARPAPEERRQA